MGSLAGTKIAVTGAGGFIGSHLTEALVAAGAKVRAMVRYNSRNEKGALAWVPEEVASEVDLVLGDVRDSESVAELIEGCETVFHLAAQIAIPYSYVNPRDFFETNVTGSLNVAQACRRTGTRRLVGTSTSEVYGSAQQVPITEDHPLSAQSPYAASKIGADQLLLSFHRSFELPVTLLRPFNTYGPRQSARAVIPTIISQALQSPAISLGSLEPRRDLTYVSDCVAGFIAAAQSDDAVGATLQLGTGRDVSVGELVAEIAATLGRDLQVTQEDARVRPGKSEVMRLISEPRKMTEMTGWTAQTSLRDGLAETIGWIESRPDLYAVDQYVI